MSGHSKWKTTKHKKAITDNKRASVWTKLIREITVAAKAGGGDPSGNARLRKAIDDGRAANMPNDNIERAIKKGTGELEGASYEEVTYEGYGPGGAAMLIEGSTDNANRTVAEIRHAFSRNNGNLGTTNSVAWMFEKKGQILLPVSDLRGQGDGRRARRRCQRFRGRWRVLRREHRAEHLPRRHRRAEGQGLHPEVIGDRDGAEERVKLEADDAQKLLKLVDALEELEDVSKVFTNLNLDTVDLEEAERLTSAGTVTVLGVDPGTAILGYGVVTAGGTGPARLLECGVVRTKASEALPVRLASHFRRAHRALRATSARRGGRRGALSRPQCAQRTDSRACARRGPARGTSCWPARGRDFARQR